MLRRHGPTAVIAMSLCVGGCGDPPAAQVPGPVVASTSDVDQVRAADVSILFVGNSHTGNFDIPGLVCDLVRALQPGKTTYSYYVPVGHLGQVANDPRCRTEIESRPWKFVVLQAQKISVSGKFEYSRAEGIDLARLAKARGAGVVFYPEWGLKGMAGDGARQEKVYREMARDAGVGVAPVARAWDLALAERPELELHAEDGNHQAPLGAFLTACVLAGRLTGESPARLATFEYAGASAADRKFLADIAAKALAAEKAP
jgi:hypothetical protein